MSCTSAVVGADRLVTTGGVDDREAAVAEAGERVLEEALAVGPAVGDAAGHGGQEGGVGRAPEPGNATHGRRSLQGSAAVDSPMVSVPRRVGVTVPLPGVQLHEHREWYEEIAALGFTDVWSGEANAHDGFTPLALAAAWAPSLRGGVAIAPAFTRGPALLAQTAASMADAAPGRFALGIGASSPAIVRALERRSRSTIPSRATRDVLRFLRRALAGEKVTERYDTFAIEGFRLGIAPEEPPPLLVAALRPRMLRLAGERGRRRHPQLAVGRRRRPGGAATSGGKEIVGRIFVVPSDDFDEVRAIARAPDHRAT